MTESSITERIGVHQVALTFLERFGWIEREQYVADFGIDTQIEIVENNNPTGLLYSVQVKAGESYLKGNQSKITYYPKDKHRKYWLNHSLPVILIICDIKKNKKYWSFVNRETVIKTKDGDGWKIDIPKTNLLDNDDSIYKIKNHYFNTDNFTIVESDIDTSHGLSRRISMKVIVQNNISELILKNQIPILVNGLKNSDYYRSEIVEASHKDKKADCVWIWFYRNHDQYTNGLPYCTVFWNDPDSKSPTTLTRIDDTIDDIKIQWTETEIPQSFLSQKLPKGKYLQIIDNYISNVEVIYGKILDLYNEYKINKDFQLFRKSTLKFNEFHDDLLPEEYHQNFPPLNCSDLNQSVLNITAYIDNVFIVLSDKNRDEKNMIQCVEMQLKYYSESIDPVKYERKKVI